MNYSLNNVNMSKYLLLKESYDGEFLGVTDRKDLVNREVDGFVMRVVYMPDWLVRIKLLKNLYFLLYSLSVCLYRHYFVRPYDLIVAREPQLAGPLALIFKWVLRRKLVVELNGNYASEYVWEDIENIRIRKIKRSLSLLIIPFVLRRADAVKLLYPSQIEPFLNEQEREQVACYVFHEYTPISMFEPVSAEGKTILTMGYPYNIKGFDIAIKAFNRIADKCSDFQLHLVGWLSSSDREYLESLICYPAQIKLLAPSEYSEAMEKMAQCEFFVLASRTEGMGRVLLEAMAHGKAVIGSSADGIPHYIEDGVVGYVFRSEDDEHLAEKMLDLVKNDSLRKEMGVAGAKIVNAKYSESEYLRHYMKLFEQVLVRN